MVWKNTVALVTGAASGLGKETARHILKNGGKVVACDLQQSNGKEIYKLEQNCIFVPCDVSSESDVQNALELCKEDFGHLDVLVNSASISQAFKVANLYRKTSSSLAILNNIFKPDVYGTFNVIRLAAPFLAEGPSKLPDNQNGVIINVSGTTAYEGLATQAFIAAAKGAVNSMTLPLAREFAPMKIRVLAIAVGYVESPILSEYALTKFAKDYLNTQPLIRRMGRPEEFSQFIEDIVKNPMLNGEILKFSGGLRQYCPGTEIQSGYDLKERDPVINIDGSNETID